MSVTKTLTTGAVLAVLTLSGAAMPVPAVAAPDTGSSLTGSSGPSPVFEDSTEYYAGGLGSGVGSQTMAVGDFFHDGNQSVVATGVGGGVAVLRGDGHSHLSRTQFIGTEIGTNSVVAGDLRGTGSLDLVVTNQFSITVLFNDGNGNFTVDREYALDPNPNVTYRTGGLPFSVQLGDFDHTGHLDIAFNNLVPVPGAIGVMRNDGTGHFAEPQWLAAGLIRSTVLAADVDHDGYTDLITGDLGTSGFWVLLNDHHGGFLPPRWNLLPLPDEDLKVADMDGDGNADIISANVAAFSFSVNYGDGHGNFGPPQLTFGQIGPCAVAVGDFTGNGRKDVAALQFAPSTAMIYRNNGDRTFSYVEQHTVGLGAQGAEAARLDNDRHDDLISMSALSESVAVLRNRIPLDPASGPQDR
ncbi:FG-GAP repeat domain-containing protein [Nocardia sp. NBC_01327]|uniref:FG-GAP repeat domain-containing protein n=1 Tax=Nocardia sp. NBC_01327 TaxID=2903593 RepID=UPI002E0ED78A|nr:VCBS repeat-containing protein [Nocardia sp. NBC_01327]